MQSSKNAIMRLDITIMLYNIYLYICIIISMSPPAGAQPKTATAAAAVRSLRAARSRCCDEDQSMFNLAWDIESGKPENRAIFKRCLRKKQAEVV